MNDAHSSTCEVEGWLAQWREGDRVALDRLVDHAVGRLHVLARRMLNGHPALRRWTDTGDVQQNAILRLLRAVEDVRPASARDFYGLATLQIRRELIDMSRHFYGPQGLGKNHASQAAGPSSDAALFDPQDNTMEPASLAQWSELHQQIDRLPDEEREVVDLVFYQGLTQAQAAELLGLSARTVLRRWHAALVKLHRILGDPSCPTPTR